MSRIGAAEIEGVPFSEILAAEGFPDESRAAVYLSGSLVAGTGNPWSDIDVFAITDRPAAGPYVRHAETNDVVQHYLNGRRCDFEFWRPDRVRDMARRVSGFIPGTGDHLTRTLFTHIEECFIHRLRIGIPLFGEPLFRGYQALFDFTRFGAYQTQEVIRTIDALLEDLCGMMEAGDWEVALFTARELVGQAVDAYCHHLGDTDPARKWRAKHLERWGGDTERHREVSEAFWRLQFPDAAALRRDPVACHEYLEGCVRFANRVVSWIQT